MNDKDVLIVTTGSQGEANSALFRMSIGEHRHVKIKPTDLIVLSSRAIPGNEGSISGSMERRPLKKGRANIGRTFDESRKNQSAEDIRQAVAVYQIGAAFLHRVQNVDDTAFSRQTMALSVKESQLDKGNAQTGNPILHRACCRAHHTEIERPMLPVTLEQVFQSRKQGILAAMDRGILHQYGDASCLMRGPATLHTMAQFNRP